MIYYLYGENSFEIERELARIIAGADEIPEKIDGEEVAGRDLPDIFAGQTLFSMRRLIVIRGLGDNKSVWSELENYLDKITDDTTVVLIDTKPDKRTRTYKALQSIATLRECKILSEREIRGWLTEFASSEFQLRLGTKETNLLVERLSTDQWALYHALQKLSVYDEITTEIISKVIDSNPQENVFLLLDSALRGDQAKVQQIIAVLEPTEDGFRTFGLLTSQVISLIALSLAGPDDNVAKDFSASPFALQKLRRFATELSPTKRRRIVEVFAGADSELKLGAEPWLVIAKTLAKV